MTTSANIETIPSPIVLLKRVEVDGLGLVDVRELKTRRYEVKDGLVVIPTRDMKKS